MAAVNWPPSAYDPHRHWMYICANENANGARMDARQFEPPTFKESFRGGGYAGAGTQSSGIYTAMDVTTNRIVWQKRFNDGCRSGSLVTGGGLVFLGRNDGRVTALDSANGERLWQFQTEAPVNSGITTFMHKGRQMVVAYAGGGFVSAKKADGVWLFGLDGKLGPIAPARAGGAGGAGAAAGAGAGAGAGTGAAGAGRGGAGAVATPAPARAMPQGRTADISSGEKIYKAACIYCHGENGHGGEGGGKAISPTLGVDGVFAVVNAGRDKMPAFGGALSAEQLQDLATFIDRKLLAKPR
jgi:mono/diheme cytochrome c family protein